MKSQLSKLHFGLLQDDKIITTNKEIYQKIEDIGQALPFIASGCFEYYLGENEGQIDLNISLSYELNDHLLEMDWEAFTSLVPDKILQKSFQPIVKFWENWAKEDFRLSPFIDYVWLVFDMPKSENYAIQPWYYIMYQANAITLDTAVKASLIKQSLVELNLNSAQIDIFHEIFSNFPAKISVRSIGFKPLQNQTIRAYLFAETLVDMFAFLEKYNWPGSIPNFKNELDDFSLLSFKFAIAADFSPEIQPKIGVELYFKDEDFGKILGLLMEKKLCNESTRNALLTWKGEVELDNENDDLHWPKAVQEKLVNAENTFKIKKYIPLIKLIYEEGKTLGAKFYLYYKPDF